MCFLVGCHKESNSIPEGLYLSFTVTHGVTGSDGFESDVYYFNLEEQEVKKIATVPYTSQYPLAVYDANDNVVFYSAQDPNVSERKDELYCYNISTEKTQKLTSTLTAINYIIPRMDTIILGAIDDQSNKGLGIKVYDKITGDLKILPWNEDDFIDNMTYNPLTDTVVFSCSSLKEKYKVLDLANDAGIEPYGVNNYVYLLNEEKYNLQFEVAEGYIENLVADNKAIYYQLAKGIYLKEGEYFHYRYDLDTHETAQIDSGLKNGRTVYVDEERQEIYYVNGAELAMINLDSKHKKVIYSTVASESYINNAHIVNKDN